MTIDLDLKLPSETVEQLRATRRAMEVAAALDPPEVYPIPKWEIKRPRIYVPPDSSGEYTLTGFDRCLP